MEQLNLSLQTFDPANAEAPYLNTPRSLEACRLLGVTPIELVEIPLEEFRKKCPDDQDTAQRRFEKIDGARRRLVKEVTAQWKTLVTNKWIPPVDRVIKKQTKDLSECIISVEPIAHTTLLDLQAERFRKVEENQWKDLTRLVATEIRNAVHEAQMKNITNKHSDIKANNDRLKRERQLAREKAYQERCEYQRKVAADLAAEQKRLQNEEAAAVARKKQEKAAREKQEKYAREQREMERVQREEYTKNLKARIYESLAVKSEEQGLVWEMRAKETTERINAEKEAKRQAIIAKRLETEERLRKANQDLEMEEHVRTETLLSKMEADDRRRKEMEEKRKEELRLANEEKTQKMQQKMGKIKQNLEGAEGGKVERTIEHIAIKEEIARQELEKVAAQMERRRRLKAIRQEAYDIAAARQRKADEHRKARIEHEIKAKESRCNAINEGYSTLSYMSTLMKDVMGRAREAIRVGVMKLQKEDDFSPDRVKELTDKITSELLLPMLQQHFGATPITKDGTLYNEAAGTATGTLRPLTTSQSFSGTGFNDKDDLNRIGDSQDDNGGETGGVNGDIGDSAMFASRASTTANDTAKPGSIFAEKLGETEGSPSGGKSRALGRSGSLKPKLLGANSSIGQGVTLPLQPINLDSLSEVMIKSEERARTAYTALHPASPTNLSSTAGPETHRRSQSTGGNGLSASKSLSPLKGVSRANTAATNKSRGGISRVGTSGGMNSTGDPLNDSYRSMNFGGDDDDDNNDDYSPRSRGTGNATNDNTRYNRQDKKSAVVFGVRDSQSDVHTNDVLPTSFSDSGEFENCRHDGSVSNMPLSRGPSSRAMPRGDLHHKSNPDLNQSSNDEIKGQFRREYSSDHPLAGGSGRYKSERQSGLSVVGGQKRGVVAGKKKIQSNKSSKPEVVVFRSTKPHPDNQKNMMNDPQKFLDNLRKEQNDLLLKLLELERRAEDDRAASLKLLSNKDVDERNRLELVFAEERRRASERIVVMTRTHEKKLKEAVIQVELNRAHLNN